jgi:outer membrane protein assembly factor BamB
VLSDKGKLILVEATPEAYKEISSFQALEGKSWTAPSFANGKVFLRNLTEMACYKLK